MPGIPVQSPVDNRGFHVKQLLGSGSAPSHLVLLEQMAEELSEVLGRKRAIHVPEKLKLVFRFDQLTWQIHNGAHRDYNQFAELRAC